MRAGKNGRKASQDEPWHIRYMGKPDAAPQEQKPADVMVASADSKPVIDGAKVRQAITRLVDRVRNAVKNS